MMPNFISPFAERRLLWPISLTCFLSACSASDDGTSQPLLAGGGASATPNASGATTATGGMPIEMGGAGGGSSQPGGANSGGSAGEMGAGGDPSIEPSSCAGGEEPPLTWQEHWFEHEQIMERVYFDDCVAVYFDSDMDLGQVAWISEFMSQVWDYSLRTYGDMGPGRLYALFHQDKYFGGHPSYYYSETHDNRNVVDQGGNNWNEGAYDVPSHEVAHIVESTALHQRSPAFGLWKDSKWAEFYQYDLYLGLGMEEEAQRLYDHFMQVSDDFPVPGSYWFRDWFFPLWRDYGGAEIMANFFRLLGEHYDGSSMNWGEYVHFTSAAASTDVKPLATAAFGWPAEWETQWNAARAEYSELTY